MNLDWDKLRVFLAVADHGSMSAAAKRMKESPPTVSRKMDELERSLNTVLLNRTTRGVDLSEAGKIVLRHVRVMSDAAEALIQEASDRDKPVEGPISLSTGDGLGPYWVAPKLSSFHMANPKVELQLTISNTPSDILGGEADIMLCVERPQRSDLITRPAGTLHYMFFASQDYLDTYGEPSSLFELYNHRCLFHEDYVAQIENWAPKSAELRKILDFALITNSATALLQNCAHGGGIAVLPSYASTVEPKLIPLDLPEVAPVQFWLIYSERVRRLQRGRAVIDWLRILFDTKKIPWFKSAFIHPNRLEEVPSFLEEVN